MGLGPASCVVGLVATRGLALTGVAGGLPPGCPRPSSAIVAAKVGVLALLLGLARPTSSTWSAASTPAGVPQGRAADRADRGAVRRRPDLRAQPDPLRPARLRGRRQRRGRAPGRHQRAPDQDRLLRHLLHPGGHRRHPRSPRATTRSPRPRGGSTTLLLAVGAAVIGGTSLFGGKGRVVDAIIGGLVIAVIAQRSAADHRSGSAIQFVVTGLVLLLAASVDAISRRRAAATGSLRGRMPARAGAARRASGPGLGTAARSGRWHRRPGRLRSRAGRPPGRPPSRGRSAVPSRRHRTDGGGLNRSTIGALVTELAGLGAVVEHRPDGARGVPGGRRSWSSRPARSCRSSRSTSGCTGSWSP